MKIRHLAAKLFSQRIKSPYLLDLSRSIQLEPAKSRNFKQLHSINVPDTLNLHGLVIDEAYTEFVSIASLVSSGQDSIPLIDELDWLNFINYMEIMDPVEIEEINLQSKIHIISIISFNKQSLIINDALDDGLCPPEIEIAGDIIVDSPFATVIHIFDDETSFPKTEILYDIVLDELFSAGVISLFEPIPRSRTVGKDYTDSGKSVSRERNATQPSLTDSVTKCLHGIVRSQCSICVSKRSRAVRRRTERKSQIVDVFEQLRYILQPPILPPSGEPVIFPNGLKPYPFQITGVGWLVQHRQALLADQMGLGKTIQAIIAMRILFRRGELQRVLVVCPASMTNVWERELKSWAPELRPVRVQGSQWLRLDIWKAHSEIYIVSYETLRNDIAQLASNRFDLCVLDEAQKIKNPQTKTHRAMKRLKPQYSWALTGTPIENKVDDVVAIFDILKPELFANDELKLSSVVRRKIKPYLLRRTIEDAQLELPELTHQNHWLDLLPTQRTSYDELENQGVEDIERRGDKATRIHILALITQLKQICNYDDESGQSCKLNFLRDELQSLVDDNDKALVFSQYPVKTLKKIQPKLQEFDPLIYDGTLSSTKRDEVVFRFQESDNSMALLMSVRAGGMGLTLTRANHVFHFDHWWNPAIVDQASARVRRIGQKKPVFVHSLYASNTIEERIFNLLEEKKAIFQAVFGGEAVADDDGLKNLTDEDLFGLFGLNAPGKDGRSQPPPPLMPKSPAPLTPKDFHSMSPREFEESIQEMFRHMGYNLSLTPQSSDGGIDLDGYHVSGKRIVVQCKRYKDTVPINYVRELLGVVSSDNNIEMGYLITTGKFSKNARNFALGNPIRLIDGIELEIMFSKLLR